MARPRARAHHVLFVCDRALFLAIDEIIKCKKLLDWCLMSLFRWSSFVCIVKRLDPILDQEEQVYGSGLFGSHRL